MINSLGIIGGGQLGKMLAQSALSQGLKVYVADPNEYCPASSLAEKVFVGSLSDKNLLIQLCEVSDVITYEWENVSANIIKELSKIYNIMQGAEPLSLSQDRLFEKNAAQQAGIRTVPFETVDNINELRIAVKKIGFPCVLKTRTLGYDGKGQYILRSIEDIDTIEQTLCSNCILEAFINFDLEVSAIAVRDMYGNTEIFPAAINIHKNNILHLSIANGTLNKSIEQKAAAAVAAIMDKHNLKGILAVEFFVCKDDLIFNEMAPRPHNSGHWTIEGCNISQYGQLLRALCGYPLVKVKQLQNVIMLNVLGQHLEAAQKLMFNPLYSHAVFHNYGKTDAIRNRKMGHITFFDTDIDTVQKFISDGYRI